MNPSITDDEIPFDCVKRGLYRVDELFEKIKSTVTEQFHDELGCLCICLASFYGNEIRKKFIESGQNHGFAKVEIINLITLTYFNAVAPVLAPGCGHRTSLFSKPYILWVIMAKCVDEWEKKKGDEKPMFIKQCQREFSEKVMNEFGIERGRTPDMIINLNCEEYDEIEIKNIFPQCQFFDCSNNQDGILFKTSIMTGDPKVTPFDAKTTLDQSFILHDRFFQYPCTEGYEPLPVVQVIPCGGTNTSAREAKLKVMSVRI